MTLYKTEHDKSNPYVVLNTTIARDPNVSAMGKAIWLYAFSRPDDWQFYQNEIISHFKEGREAVRSGLKSLENSGYLKRDQKKNSDGTWKKGEWTFYEKPQNKEKSTVDGFSGDGQPGHGNLGDILSKEIPSNDSVSVSVAEPDLSDTSKIFYKNIQGQWSAVFEEEIRASLQSYEERIIDETISRMRKMKAITDPYKCASGTAENVAKEFNKKEKAHDNNVKGKSVRGRDTERRGVFVDGVRCDGPQTRNSMDWWRARLSEV